MVQLYRYSISMVKPVRASTVGASFVSGRSSAHRVDNPHLAAIDLGDREAKTRWSFRVSYFVTNNDFSLGIILSVSHKSA